MVVIGGHFLTHYNAGFLINTSHWKGRERRSKQT